MAGMRSYGPAVTIDGEQLHCASCGHLLGSTVGGYEAGAAVAEVPASSLGPQFASDARLRLVVFTCPECETCLKTVLARGPEDRVPDFRGLDRSAGEER